MDLSYYKMGGFVPRKLSWWLNDMTRNLWPLMEEEKRSADYDDLNKTDFPRDTRDDDLNLLDVDIEKKKQLRKGEN